MNKNKHTKLPKKMFDKMDLKKLKEDQHRRLKNLIDEINDRMSELNIYQDNQFYNGFYNYYDKKLEYVSNLRSQSGYSQLSIEEFNKSEVVMKDTFSRINQAYKNGDYALSDRLIEELKASVEDLNNDAMKNYQNILISAQEKRWNLKNQQRYLTENFTNKTLIKAKDIFERTGKTEEPIKLIMDLLNDPKVDIETKTQATKYNNILVKHAQKGIQQYDTIRGFEDEINLLNNDKTARDVEKMCNETIDELNKMIDNFTSNVKKNNRQSSNEIFNKAYKLIDETTNKGLTLLATRTEWIHETAENQDKKTDRLKRMDGIKEWFVRQMSSLHKQVDTIQEQVLIAGYDNQREALINAKINNLNTLISKKTYGKDNTKLNDYGDYYRNLQLQSEQVQKDIAEYINDLNDKIMNASPDTKQALMNKRQEMLRKQQEIKEKCNTTTLTIKQNFSEKIPEIINRINNTELMININKELALLIPGYNKEEVVADKKGDVKVDGKDEKEKEKKKKDIRAQISHIIESLKKAKILLRSRLNLKLGTEYDDEINNLFDNYFESRINSLTNILSDLEENYHYNSKEKALKTVEKIITSFPQLESKIQNCKVPQIYEYYCKYYFDYLFKALDPIKNEFDDLESTNINTFGRNSTYELLKSRLQVVKNKFTTYFARFQEKLQQLTNNYNRLLQEKRGTPNEQIKELKQAITDMNIKVLFDAYAAKFNHAYYDKEIDKDGVLSAQASPKKPPEEEKKKEGV